VFFIHLKIPFIMRQQNENWRSSSRREDEGRENDRGRYRGDNETNAQRNFNRYDDDGDDDYREGRRGMSGYSSGYGGESQNSIGNDYSQGGGYDRGAGNFGGGRGGSSWNSRNQGSYGRDWNNDDSGSQDYDSGYGRYGMYSSGGNRDTDRSQFAMGNRGGNMGSYNSGQSNRGGGQSWNRDWNSPGNRDWNSNNRDWNNDNRGQQERGWWDRTRDEMSSWFGDDDAERRRRMDKMGEHRGKGPKNYQRSEERIREDISDRLADDDSVDASDIEIKVSGTEVTLSGTVESRVAKRRAEDIAESVSGVSNVQNQLRVGQNSDNTASSTSKSKSSSSVGNNMKTEKMHHN
jgi:osmotically-inducible protein OsmY